MPYQRQAPKTEMFTLYAETNGADLTETLDLTSPLIYDDDAYLRIPKGMKLKIHAIRLYGDVTAVDETQILVMHTHDVTAGPPPTWVESASVYFDGIPVTDDRRRPIIFTGYSGDEAVSFDWLQTVAAEVAYVEIDVEYTPA